MRDIVLSGLPVSARLVLGAVLIQVVVGIGVGVLAAVSNTFVVRWAIHVAVFVAVAIPAFVLAYLLQKYLAAEVHLFPRWGVSQGWTSYVLPTLALAAAPTAFTVRMLRIELGSTMRTDFAAYARAKGLSRSRVIGVHAMKASMLPIVALIAASAAQIVGGLIIVESVFRVPGIGAAVIDAIRWKDHNVIVAILGVGVVFSVAVSTFADLVHPVIDPRIETRSPS